MYYKGGYILVHKHVYRVYSAVFGYNLHARVIQIWLVHS